MRTLVIASLLLAALPFSSHAQSAPAERARDLGVPFDGTTGKYNAITDVAGVEVGYKTLFSGDGRLEVGKGPVRTGVTAILPRGKDNGAAVFAGFFIGNGNGDMTGTHWIDESGILETPIMITNTLSVGVVRDATVHWMTEKNRPGLFWYPVTAETADAYLNDIKGQHVTAQDALDALNSASGGPVAEGNIGGGTGMVCNGFKGGSGTSSRVVTIKGKTYTVGTFVQCNYGGRDEFRMAGIPVAREMKVQNFCLEKKLEPTPPMFSHGAPPMCDKPAAGQSSRLGFENDDRGSIIVVVATDAPLTPYQLKRLTKRVPLGLARAGAIEADSSGDLFLAFSTASTGADNGNSDAPDAASVSSVGRLTSEYINPLFLATIETTEEAVDNAMIAAKTMTGANDLRVTALPHDQLREILREHKLLVQPGAAAAKP